MSMTANEMIVFFGEQAEGSRDGMTAAGASSNYYIAAMNCSEALKCRLMQGLISWRTASDPTEFFERAVQGFSDDWKMLMSIGGDTASLSDVPAERVAFVSCLIGRQELPVAIDTDGLESDRLLDAVLGKWLFGSWDDSLWQRGIEQLQQSGSNLALDTYSLYRDMVQASSADLSTLMKNGESLFDRRRSDKFFSGGDQTEGGGDDNKFTVDYRLASLAKRLGYTGGGRHAWLW